MSLDLKIYVSNKLDLNDKDLEMKFIDYFEVLTREDDAYDTLSDIENKCESTCEEDGWDDRKTFKSYVFSFNGFEEKILNSKLKKRILDACEKYRENYGYIVCQRF